MIKDDEGGHHRNIDAWRLWDGVL